MDFGLESLEKHEKDLRLLYRCKETLMSNKQPHLSMTMGVESITGVSLPRDVTSALTVVNTGIETLTTGRKLLLAGGLAVIIAMIVKLLTGGSGGGGGGGGGSGGGSSTKKMIEQTDKLIADINKDIQKMADATRSPMTPEASAVFDKFSDEVLEDLRQNAKEKEEKDRKEAIAAIAALIRKDRGLAVFNKALSHFGKSVNKKHVVDIESPQYAFAIKYATLFIEEASTVGYAINNSLVDLLHSLNQLDPNKVDLDELRSLHIYDFGVHLDFNFIKHILSFDNRPSDLHTFDLAIKNMRGCEQLFRKIYASLSISETPEEVSTRYELVTDSNKNPILNWSDIDEKHREHFTKEMESLGKKQQDPDQDIRTRINELKQSGMDSTELDHIIAKMDVMESFMTRSFQLFGYIWSRVESSFTHYVTLGKRVEKIQKAVEKLATIEYGKSKGEK